MAKLSITISDTGGRYLASIGPQAQHIKMSTQSPGGCYALQFQVAGSVLAIPPYLGPNYDIQVSDDQGIVWRGRIEDVEAIITERSEYFLVTALGYAVNLDDDIVTSYNPSGKATDVVVSDNIPSTTPQIDSVDITTTGITLGSGMEAITNNRPREIVNWAATFGNSSSRRMLWHVWPTATAARQFEFVVAPTTPEYAIYFRELIGGQAGYQFKNYANKILVRYASGASSLIVQDTVAQGTQPDGVNVKRAKLLDLAWVPGSSDATTAGNTGLAFSLPRQMRTAELRLGGHATIIDNLGQKIAPQRVRAGKIMRFMDMQPADGASANLTWLNSFFIAQTEWDDDSQVLTLRPL